jgi:hypothetical protein
LTDFLPPFSFELLDLCVQLADLELGRRIVLVDLLFELLVCGLELLVSLDFLFHLVEESLLGGLVLELSFEFLDFF